MDETMRLFIAEKPELAKAILKGIGGIPSNADKGRGYHEYQDNIVTWCYGHMLALKDPEEIDEKYTYWEMSVLPIPPTFPAPRKIPADKKKQVAVIRELVKKADVIVNAGDPDDEGQLLIDELLRYFGNKKQVLRVLINDNTLAVVQKSLANLKPNSEFEHFGWKAESRMIADQLFGYNLTRAYSLQEEAITGKKNTQHIGRVQTPIIGLIVRRDREHKAYVKSFYYTIQGDFAFNGIVFIAKYQPKDTDPIDDKNRLIDKVFANNLANLLTNQNAKILLATTKTIKEPAPLPFDLLSLQQDASRKYGLSSAETDKIAQSLKDKHTLITYHRTDCRYLSDEQFANVASVLSAIKQTLPNAEKVCQFANPSLKGKAFNSSKVGIHHGITPTVTPAVWSNLTEDEQNIYKLIVRNYIAQFYPPYEYDETKLILDVLVDDKTYQFNATARCDKAKGWKTLFANDSENEKVTLDVDTLNLDLRQLNTGAVGKTQQIISEEKQTQPQPLYTETTLLGDLVKVAKYMKDPRLAQVFKDKDKDKEGGNGGIGTPATRSGIIKNLLARGYIQIKGKTITSTPLGQNLYDKLDDLIRFPDMSAVWHEQQQAIQNQEDVKKFVAGVMTSTISPTIAKLKQSYIAPTSKQPIDLSNNPPCPRCGRPLRFNEQGKFGAYWGCTGWNAKENPCNHSMNDNNGVPVERPVKAPVEVSEFKCKKCKKPLIWRKSDEGGKDGKGYSFFGCSGFPKCKQKYDELNGEPKYV